jgi:hypothetical protein
MKKYYELEIELISFDTQDVVRTSSDGFFGDPDTDGFGKPNFN